MINRKPTILRDLKTGFILTRRLISRGETGLFKKRPYSYKQAFIDTLFFLTPFWLICAVAVIYGILVGNYDGVLRVVTGGTGISLMMVWVTHGVFGNELGACGSETD